MFADLGHFSQLSIKVRFVCHLSDLLPVSILLVCRACDVQHGVSLIIFIS